MKRFFKRRFRYEPETWPTWQDVLDGEEDVEEEEGGQDTAEKVEGAAESGEGSKPAVVKKKRLRLDEEVEASGWKLEMQQQLEEVSQCLSTRVSSIS